MIKEIRLLCSPLGAGHLVLVDLHEPGHGVVAQHQHRDLLLCEEPLKRPQHPLLTFHPHCQLLDGLVRVLGSAGE